MKVLFVGEGSTDIGPAEFGNDARLARGPVPILSRKLIPEIDRDSVALQWRELVRFNPSAKKRGFEAKVMAAILVSATRLACSGTICITDQDRDASRLAAMETGSIRGRELVEKSHPTACGLAVESIEAWTLALPTVIAEVLSIDNAEVSDQYPKGKHVEEFCESSGKDAFRPKQLLGRIAKLAHRNDDIEFREEVAERTDTRELESACPRGFKPFADALRASFRPSEPI